MISLYAEWASRVTAFLNQYVDVKAGGYDADGNMTIETMRQSIGLLLHNRVYRDMKAIQRGAIRTHNVLIPDDLFPFPEVKK